MMGACVLWGSFIWWRSQYLRLYWRNDTEKKIKVLGEKYVPIHDKFHNGLPSDWRVPPGWQASDLAALSFGQPCFLYSSNSVLGYGISQIRFGLLTFNLFDEITSSFPTCRQAVWVVALCLHYNPVRRNSSVIIMQTCCLQVLGQRWEVMQTKFQWERTKTTWPCSDGYITQTEINYKGE